jgi:recombination protein RecA
MDAECGVRGAEKPKPGTNTVAELLANVEKRWGRGALMRLGGALNRADLEVIPTGSPALDDVLGVGGVPCGRISEIFGPDSSGKQSLVGQMAVQCQRAGGAVAYVDMGGRLDPDQMLAQGVDFDSMLVARPDGHLQGLEMAIRLARSGGIKLILLDMALPPRLSTPTTHPIPPVSHHIALSTQRSAPKTSLGLALRRLVSAVDRNGVAFVFIADAPTQSHPDPDKAVVPGHPLQLGQARSIRSGGGSALRFFASVRLRVERLEWIRRGRDVMGCRSLIQVAKNKLAPPLRETRVDLLFYRFPPEAPAMALCRPIDRSSLDFQTSEGEGRLGLKVGA